MYVSNTTKEKYEQSMEFGRRIKKFKDSLVPGMSLKVHPSTDSPQFDSKVRLAKVVGIYGHYVHLQDDKGNNYGPTYAKLLEWGNT